MISARRHLGAATPRRLGPAVRIRFESDAQPVLRARGDLTLRAWRDDDVPAVRAAYQDPAIQHWHVRRLDSDEATHRLVTDWHDLWPTGDGAGWAVVDGNDQLLGRVGLGAFDLFRGAADVVYWTVPAARGRHVAPHAAKAAAQWALSVGFQRLELRHSTANSASCTVAARAGFAGERVHRSALRHADGWHDMHAHALVAVR